MEKAVSYIRVSSKEQQEQGFSLQAQKKLVRAYAKRKGLTISKEYEEVETAKKAGRTQFEGMIRHLKDNPGIRHILVEKTDRLYRNFRDLVTIDELDRNIHLVKENTVIGPDSKSHDKLVHNFKVVLAKNYIDNLSEETSKGMKAKAELGLWPSYAPLGYINNRETKGIDVDFKRAPIIRELFERYATNKMNLRQGEKFAWDKGLRTRKGNLVSKSNIYRMLSNPIYIGDFKWDGIYYKGKHNPIVSREVFEKVQGVLNDRSKPRKRNHKFAFRGLMKCGSCGRPITAQIQKGKYVYYHCTRTGPKCTEKAIREEKLAQMLGEPLKRLRIGNERLEWILQALRESHEEEKRFKAEEVGKLEREYQELGRKIDQLYEDKLSGLVPVNFWKSKYQEYISRQNRIQERIEEHTKAEGDYLENGARILELAQKAYSLYVTQDSWEQRKLLDLVHSNSVLKGGKVYMELRKPFDMLADGIVQEEKLRKEKAPEEAINKNWLPIRNPLRNVLSFFKVTRELGLR